MTQQIQEIMIKVSAIDSSKLAQGAVVTNGIIVVKSNKAGGKSASIMFEETSTPSFEQMMLGGQYAQESKKVHFINGSPELLTKMVESQKLVPGMELPFRIVVIESTINPGNGVSPKINPTTKATMTHQGLPIFRGTKLVAESSNEADVLLKADSVSSVRTDETFVSEAVIKTQKLEAEI